MESLIKSGKLVRVVVTGSESTGKSVLASQLADHYDADLVTEFVRDFAITIGRELRIEDVDSIAHGQIALEDASALRATRLLIQDTDLLSTVVYSDHYYDYCAPWIRQAALERRPDLYLLMDIDVPWVPDGIRDREGFRSEIHKMFRDAVIDSGAPHVAISGSWERRTALARDAIDRVLASSQM